MVAGTELSEKARSQMVETQKTTTSLADAVKQIANSSRLQVRLTKEIAGRADELRSSALNTQKELEEQRQQSDRLNEYAEHLALSVGQFTLPEAETN